MNLQELKDLKVEWNAEHRKIMDALDLVIARLETAPLSTRLLRVATAPQVTNGRQGSNRQIVLDCIVGKWKSVDQIVEITELDAKRIRGVLYSPELKQPIEKKDMDGTVVFRTKSKEGSMITSTGG